MYMLYNFDVAYLYVCVVYVSAIYMSVLYIDINLVILCFIHLRVKLHIIVYN